MIIVSQDREDIINFDNVKMINREENRISVDANFGRGDFYCIAEYDTEERAVQKILDKITDRKFNQIEIWKVIQLKSWDATDNTFKPICNRLRELGYEIINNE